MGPSAAYRRVAWLVMAALFAQSWLGAFAGAMADERKGGIVICAGGGFQVIDLGPEFTLPDSPPAPETEHRRQGLDCSLCLIHALAQLKASPAPDVLPMRWSDTTIAAIGDQRPSSAHRRDDAHRSRAPPLA